MGFFLIFFLLLIIIVLAGPRIPLRVETTFPEIPDFPGLANWLAETEGGVAGLRVGKEKGIVWANPDEPARTPLSIIYLHGFSASRAEIEPVTSRVAAELGANLYFSRLRGHGADPEELRQVTINDWSRDVLEAFAIGAAIGEKVIVIGTSNGGAWATWLASLPLAQDSLERLILIAPNFHPANPQVRMLTWPWARFFMPLLQGEYREFEAASPEHAEGWYLRYPFAALFPLMGTVQLIERTVLELVEVPTLILYNPGDTTVSVAAIEAAFTRLPNPANRLTRVDILEGEDPHVLTGAIRSPSSVEKVIKEILYFVKKD
jgi:esterase/lipase